jgi:hypothetical protein
VNTCAVDSMRMSTQQMSTQQQHAGGQRESHEEGSTIYR